MVIFDPDVYPMDRSWITGRVSADHLRHSRPEYYARLAAEARALDSPAVAAPEDTPPGADSEKA
jgi:hypothetical protein